MASRANALSSLMAMLILVYITQQCVLGSDPGKFRSIINSTLPLDFRYFMLPIAEITCVLSQKEEKSWYTQLILLMTKEGRPIPSCLAFLFMPKIRYISVTRVERFLHSENRKPLDRNYVFSVNSLKNILSLLKAREICNIDRWETRYSNDPTDQRVQRKLFFRGKFHQCSTQMGLCKRL